MLLSNNTVVLCEGAIPIIENQTILEFDVRGTHFPIRGGGPPVEGDNINFGFSVLTQSVGEIMHIDLQDGSGVKDIAIDSLRPSPGSYSILRLGALRFADIPESEGYKWNYGEVRKIKIWFSNPSTITAIRFYYMHLHGEFPKEIANYNLDTLVLSSTNYLEIFPNSLHGGVFKSLTLAGVGPAFTDIVPNWTLKSYINALVFQNSLDLSRAPNLTRYDQLHQIEGMRTLDLSGCKLNNESIDDSLKKSPTLSNLSVGESRFSTFPQELANIPLKKMFRISIVNGHTITGSYPKDMSALFDCETISIDKMWGGVWTTDLFPEFEKFNFKELYFIRTYLTEERLTTLITNIYGYINTYGDKNVNNSKGKFRVKSLRLFYPPYPLNSDLRPVGLYQMPEGFVLGVSNGNPKTPMEMIWVLVQQYYWTVRLRSQLNELPGLETLAP